MSKESEFAKKVIHVTKKFDKLVQNILKDVDAAKEVASEMQELANRSKDSEE